MEDSTAYEGWYHQIFSQVCNACGPQLSSERPVRAMHPPRVLSHQFAGLFEIDKQEHVRRQHPVAMPCCMCAGPAGTIGGVWPDRSTRLLRFSCMLPVRTCARTQETGQAKRTDGEIHTPLPVGRWDTHAHTQTHTGRVLLGLSCWFGFISRCNGLNATRVTRNHSSLQLHYTVEVKKIFLTPGRPCDMEPTIYRSH